MHPSYRNTLVLVAIVQTILLVDFSTLTNGQPTTTNPPPTVNIQPYARGRIFSASTTSPMAKTLSNRQDIVDATASIIEYFEAAAATVSHALAASRGRQSRENYTMPICNTRSIPWRAAVANYGQHRGWPVERGAHCITDIYGLKEFSKTTDEELEAILFARAQGLQQMRGSILKEIGFNNWTHMEDDWKKFTLQRGSQICSLDSVAGVRVNGVWYTAIGITNRKRDEWLPSGARQYLTEHVRVEGNRLVARLMTLPVNPVTGITHRVETKSTTVLGRWGGAVEPSQFRPVAIGDNVAVEDALDKGQHYQQQVDDATTGSNIAILALPLVVSLVPLGLVADTTRKRMLAYVLVSDVAAALPMFIKGVELLQISARRFTSSVTRMGDLSVGEETTVVSEVWVASCGSPDNVGTIGIIFVVVAVVTMVVGIILEIRVRKRGKRRKVGQYHVELEEYDDEEEAWVGVALEKTK